LPEETYSSATLEAAFRESVSPDKLASPRGLGERRKQFTPFDVTKCRRSMRRFNSECNNPLRLLLNQRHCRASSLLKTFRPAGSRDRRGNQHRGLRITLDNSSAANPMQGARVALAGLAHNSLAGNLRKLRRHGIG